MDDILIRSELHSIDKEPKNEESRVGIGHFGHVDDEALRFLFAPESEAGQGSKSEETISLVLRAASDDRESNLSGA